jgi:hypothetical protein
MDYNQAMKIYTEELQPEGWCIWQTPMMHWKIRQPEPEKWDINIPFDRFSDAVSYLINRARHAWMVANKNND